MRHQKTPPQDVWEGYLIFLGQDKGDCFHCHNNDPTTTIFSFKNNGLDAIHTDSGLAHITGKPEHIGLFKVPSLRNLVFTAPYMHDGRFNTLEEVINFYDTGTKNSPTV